MAYSAGKQPTRVAGMSVPGIHLRLFTLSTLLHASLRHAKQTPRTLTSARSPLSTSSDTYHLFCAPASALHTYCRRRDNYAHHPSHRRTLLCTCSLPRYKHKIKRPTAAAAARHPGSPAVTQQHACRPPAVALTAFLARAVAVEAATAPSLPTMAVCSTASNATSPRPRSLVKYVNVHVHIHTVTCLLAALLPPPGCCSAERAASPPRHAADLCSAGPAPPP
jgi:hypothetical protein